MASLTTPVIILADGATMSVVADSITLLPTAVLIQPGQTDAVAWEIGYQGTSYTGQAAAGALLQTVALLGALTVDDLQTYTMGPLLTESGGQILTKGPSSIGITA